MKCKKKALFFYQNLWSGCINQERPLQISQDNQQTGRFFMADQPGGLHSYPQPGSASRTGRSARDRNMGRYPLPMWKARYAGPGALPQCLNRRAGALLGNIRAHGSLWPPRLALSSILQSMNGFIIRACGRFVKDFPAYGGQPVVNRV